MPRLFMVLIVAFIGFLPMSVSAQVKPPPAQQTIEGIDPSRLVVIGVGVLAGAVVMEVLVVSDLAILAGAVAGGYVTDWWYRNQEYKIVVPKAAFRAAAFSASSDARLAMLPR